MKNRSMSHPDGPVVALKHALGQASAEGYGKTTRPNQTVGENLKENAGSMRGKKTGIGKLATGVKDVQTHVAIPSAKAMQKKSRVVGKQPRKMQK